MPSLVIKTYVLDHASKFLIVKSNFSISSHKNMNESFDYGILSKY